LSSPSHPTPPATAAAQRVSAVARHSTIYSIAPLIQRALNLLLVPLLTSRLNEAQSGVAQLTDVLIVAAIQLGGVNLLAGMVRFYFDFSDERDRRAAVSSATLFLMLFSWSLVGVLFLFRGELTRLLFNVGDPKLAHDDLEQCLGLALLIIPLALSSDAGFRYLQIQQRSTLITTLRVAKSVLEMGLKLWMVVGLGLGVSGLLASVLIGEVLTSTLLGGWMLSQVKLRFSWRVLKPMLVYTLPLVPVGLCQMGLNQLDRLLLRGLAPGSQAMSWTGIYGHGYMIAWIVQTALVGSFMQIWQPWIFAVADPAERAKLVSRVSTWAFVLVASANLGVACMGRELVHVLSGQEGYYAATRVVPWVSAGYAFFALNGLSQVPMFLAKRTLPMLWINALALVVNVAANCLLIPRFGYVGAAMATLATFLTLAAMGLFLAKGVMAVPFELRRLCAVGATVLVTMGLVLWIDARFDAELAGTLNRITALKLGLFAGVLAFLWLGVLHRTERSELAAWLRSLLRRN
jgi:O-antigen/teichoic acid export membrane protein